METNTTVSVNTDNLPKLRSGSLGSMDSFTVKKINDYYTSLLSNPRFQQTLGGRDATEALAKDLNSTGVYHEPSENNTGGMYNPLTGNITLKDKRLDPEVLAHEFGHRMYYASPAYQSAVKRVMDRHGIDYSWLYWPTFRFKSLYTNQPTEQAAQLQRVRYHLGLLPGKGSGHGGKYTDDDVKSRSFFLNSDEYFGDKPIPYIRDLLNEAKLKRIRRRAIPVIAA